MKPSGLTHQDDCEALSQNSLRLKKDRKSSREMVDKYIDGEEENECVFHAQMERRRQPEYYCWLSNLPDAKRYQA